MDSQIEINKASLKKLSKSKLIKLLLNQKKRTYKPRPSVPTPRKSVKQMAKEYEENIILPPPEFRDNYKPVPTQRTYKPRPSVPTPRKSVKKMAKEYEENIILPPPEFRDNYKPVPTQRTKKLMYKPVPAPGTKKPMDKPVPAPRTKIEQTEQALRGFTRSYEIGLINRQDPLIQLQKTRSMIKNNLLKVLNEMKGLKFNETLKITFEKQKGDELIEKEAYFNAKPQTVTNETEIANLLQITQQQIVNMIQQWISEGSAWIIKSVGRHFINVVRYRPLRGSSYIPLPKELRNPAKGIINMKNNDNECFRWCHIRHLLPQNKDPQRIKECDKKICRKIGLLGN